MAAHGTRLRTPTWLSRVRSLCLRSTDRGRHCTVLLSLEHAAGAPASFSCTPCSIDDIRLPYAASLRHALQRSMHTVSGGALPGWDVYALRQAFFALYRQMRALYRWCYSAFLPVCACRLRRRLCVTFHRGVKLTYERLFACVHRFILALQVQYDVFCLRDDTRSHIWHHGSCCYTAHTHCTHRAPRGIAYTIWTLNATFG
jgi:hypothetical protein